MSFMLRRPATSHGLHVALLSPALKTFSLRSKESPNPQYSSHEWRGRDLGGQGTWLEDSLSS